MTSDSILAQPPTFDRMEEHGHELVLFCRDPRAGYRGIIAIHSTALGPAVGGTRYWPYESEQSALRDALVLSRGMSYKNALAGLPFGGGKGVIWARDDADRRAVFQAHARSVHRLAGLHLTAEDVGSTVADMEVMRAVTPFVFGAASGMGDPAPYTARGVFRALQACAEHRWGSSDLNGRTVAIQGVGGVGYYLARELHAAGAKLIVADPLAARAERVRRELQAAVVEPAAIFDAACDVFAPCALGGILNERTIPRLRATVVVGAANNQLLETGHGALLEQRGITYGPDFVANAGGVISGAVDILGWDLNGARQRIEAIHGTMLSVLRRAAEQRVAAARAAEEMAESILKATGARGNTLAS